MSFFDHLVIVAVILNILFIPFWIGVKYEEYKYSKKDFFINRCVENNLDYFKEYRLQICNQSYSLFSNKP